MQKILRHKTARMKKSEKSDSKFFWSTMLQVYSRGAYRNVSFIDSYEVDGGESQVIDLDDLPDLRLGLNRPKVKIEFMYPPGQTSPLNDLIGKQCCLRLLVADHRDNGSAVRLKMHSKKTAAMTVVLRGLLAAPIVTKRGMKIPMGMKIEISDAKITSDKP